MKVRAVELRIETSLGRFGFKIGFDDGLTVIRGGNSSGKSTVVNSILYGLGLEELIGGKGERVLPYAVKEWLEYENERVPVLASQVLLEVENRARARITLRRVIRDEIKSHKLVEIFEGGAITSGSLGTPSRSTYLFDPGAAQEAEGFHKFLSTFLALELPSVSTTSGSETLLYLQAIFAALVVEQKRGWSDYIANIPFFGLRDARQRVVEYLLGLEVFEMNSRRNKLNQQSVSIANRWEGAVRRFSAEAKDVGVIVRGLIDRPSVSFDVSQVALLKPVEGEEQRLSEYLEGLRRRHQDLQQKIEDPQIKTDDVREEFEQGVGDLQRLISLHETLVGSRGVLKAAVQDYGRLLSEVDEDLARNKAALKLHGLGASLGVKSASNQCPTCGQLVDDSLLAQLIPGPTMSLPENIQYLEQQRSMLQRQVAGTNGDLSSKEISIRDLSTKIDTLKGRLAALREDFSSGKEQSRADIQRQYQISFEFDGLNKALRHAGELFDNLKELIEQLRQNQAERRNLPREMYSQSDDRKIAIFEKMFKANAGSFGYESAPISDITVSRDSLTPALGAIALREVRSDVRSDSSASDFIRLIWSYLLGLFQSSDLKEIQGNHPGILVLDEPGQHSMAAESQRALLNALSAEQNLQSIVAASFDEMESVFQEITGGIGFRLIEWHGKSIARIEDRTFLSQLPP